MKKIPDKQKPQIAIYHALGDEQKISVRIEDENVWLTQKLIAELFDVSVPTVNEHLKNIFESNELSENSVIRNFRITALDGKEYDTKHYTLEVILAVGYRVRSDKGTQFRKWATERLREYLIKGFTMDDERLKRGRLMKMQDWIKKLDDFLTISEKKLLHSTGSVSAKQAEYKALDEYKKYRSESDKDYISDFDREVSDYAFLLHILKSLKSTGTGAVILPHGVLFRGNAEAEIHKNIIERGYIKGIIGLPANLFYGTPIPACIIVLDKSGASDRKGIFMIDASKGFVKDGNKNRLREQDNRKVIDTWSGKLEIPKYSRFAPNDEIKKNEYNLNLPRYIDTQEPEDIQDIEAHLNGGIPDVDITALSAYWDICSTLKHSLFKANGRKGYSEVMISHDEIKKTILTHPEFDVFRQEVLATFGKWQGTSTTFLKALGNTNHPKAIIQKIADALLSVCANLHLVDKYDIYQHLMNYWDEVMQDDTHIITVDGWKSGNEVIRLQKENKGKKKDIEGLTGIEGKLIPTSLVIKTYFVKEQRTLDELNAALEQIGVNMDSLKDEHGGEDGLLSEVIDNDKVSKASVQKRIKETKNSKDDADELAILEKYLALFEKEADTKNGV